MYCIDEVLHYYVTSDGNMIDEFIGHPCLDWEHYWGFNIYNDTSIYVDTVEVWKIY